jgi:peptide/nickel transport system permease protein
MVALLGLLFLLSIGVFALLYASPGNAADVLLGARPRTPAMVAAIKSEYHLNDPLPAQYWRWLNGALHLDFGRSIRTNEPVITLFHRQASPTLFLLGYSLIITMVSGIGLGFLAAYYRGSTIDRVVVAVSVVGASSPAFATGILLIFVFGVVLSWFPVYGAGTGYFFDQLYHLTLPAIALASTTVALVAKLTRAALIGALEQDYVGFARARGLGAPRIIAMYGFRNALGPILTSINLVVANLIFGTVLVEVTFALPGLGALLVSSVSYHDLPVVQALTLLTGAIIVLVNLVVDILYLVGDPRLGFGSSAR